eukprot:m.477694 g.477694  ORF g.477694 m.477694 type:complete len:493 (+) comp20921_c0_seq1:1550-3028(+)
MHGRRTTAQTHQSRNQRQRCVRTQGPGSKRAPRHTQFLAAHARTQHLDLGTMSSVSFELNTERFVSLLTKLIGESKHVQNNPPKHVPEEDRIINHVLEILTPFSKAHGGPLTIEHVHCSPDHPKRGNLILRYASSDEPEGEVTFMGSHLDVVPADPVNWDRDPFVLTQEGDKLYGRGTTDCLGHVALLTDFFAQLCEKKPDLKVAVNGVFIASEENNSIPDIGVDVLEKQGKLEAFKKGPVFWVDSADSQPCIGTAAVATWKVRADGKLFHSGLPHKGINSLELASEAVAQVQKRFYEDFPPHEEEKRYNFASCSTMKPTQVHCAEGGLNQLPPWTEIEGDIRLTPFYNLDECIAKVTKYVEDINADLGSLPTRGPMSKYEITEDDGKVVKGIVSLEWSDDPFKGIACDLDSPGFAVLRDATAAVKGEAKPYAICGSLPLVGDLKEAGFDVQVVGYGHSSVYHGDNEYCSISDMQDATKIFCHVVNTLNAKP